MAAKEIVNSRSTDPEAVINHWLLDYYMSLALESFKNDQYEDFCRIRDLLDIVLDRPLECTDVMPTKVRILQFLSRIIDGEKLDLSFDSDQSSSPLESALTVLQSLNKECVIPQQDFETVCTSVKEMLVGIFIKNKEFEKAKEFLNKHFPKPMVGKKAIFMGLIRQKSKTHEVIEQLDFHRFKEEMLAFCKRLCPFRVPYLYIAAKNCIDQKLAAQDQKAAGTDNQDKPGPSSSPQRNTILLVPCKHTIFQRTRLEAAYNILTAGLDERTFVQLMKDVEREKQTKDEGLSLRLSPTPKKGTSQDSEQDMLFQKDSGSPMEASPADQPPQTDAAPQTQAGSLSKTPSVLRNRQLYTVARLVVEPDSQASSQCTTASQELETEVRTEQSPTVSNKKDLQSPLTDNEVSVPSRKCPRRASKRRALTGLAELSTDSEDDPPGSAANREVRVRKLQNQSSSSVSRKSTKSKQASLDSEDSFRTPMRKTRRQLASNPPSKDPGNSDDECTIDSSLDSSPNPLPLDPAPQTSSTPHKDSARGKGRSHSKWKQLFHNAKESKEKWSDEESYFVSTKSSRSHDSIISNSGHRKRKWTESETEKLKEGVRKFGEGNWSKIKAYYTFNDRTNVNLKDRWRTLKKLNLV